MSSLDLEALTAFVVDGGIALPRIVPISAADWPRLH